MPQELFRKFRYEKAVEYTDNFSESNYIGRFQFGKLYRGKTQYGGLIRYFMVKKWEVPEIYNFNPDDNNLMVCWHDKHVCMINMYAYCRESDRLCGIYNFKPFDLLFNLIPKEGFTWLQRIKTALGFASLLRFLHTRKSLFYKPFVVHNVDAANIVLDEDYNPTLCDFGSISGGIFPDKRKYSCHHGCYGCIDIASFGTGCWSNKQDVFGFGVVLISLISKKVYTDKHKQAGVPFVFEWAFTEYEAFESEGDAKDIGFSLVHESLTAEDDFCPADGHKITMLALECVNRDEHQRPTMKQVVRSLLKLDVVKQNADFLRANIAPNVESTAHNEESC